MRYRSRCGHQTVDDTKFSVKRGVYSLPFDVTISTNTLGATIRYSLDGSDPRISTNTKQGSSPLTVRIDPTSTNAGMRDLTPAVTLRAYAFKTGMTSTNVDTQTYIFVDNVLKQTRPASYPVKAAGCKRK